jgi:CBS-domain-containing membrane protein
MLDAPMASDEPVAANPMPEETTRDRRPSGPDRRRLPALLDRHPGHAAWAAYLFVNGFVTIGLLACVAMIVRSPFVFPSLGPTALMLFHDPLQPASSPRNTLCGHALGIVCGYASLWLLGLAHEPPALEVGVDAERVGGAALALASTGALMVLLRAWHPPAGATTLIIALGIMTRPYHLLIIEAAVVTLVIQALLINRIAGIPYPVWSPAARCNEVGQRGA